MQRISGEKLEHHYRMSLDYISKWREDGGVHIERDAASIIEELRIYRRMFLMATRRFQRKQFRQDAEMELIAEGLIREEGRDGK